MVPVVSLLIIGFFVYSFFFKKEVKRENRFLGEVGAALSDEERRMLISLINCQRFTGAPWADEQNLHLFSANMVLTVLYNQFDTFSDVGRKMAKSIRRKIQRSV